MGCEIVTGCVDGRMRLYDVRMGMVFVDVVGREYIRCLHRAPESIHLSGKLVIHFTGRMMWFYHL